MHRSKEKIIEVEFVLVNFYKQNILVVFITDTFTLRQTLVLFNLQVITHLYNYTSNKHIINLEEKKNKGEKSLKMYKNAKT